MEVLLTLLIILFEVFVAFIVIFVAFSMGLTVLRLLKVNLKTHLEEVYLAFLLGYCVLSTFTMILGYAALLYSSLFWVISLSWLVLQRNKVIYFYEFVKNLNVTGFIRESRLNLFTSLIWALAVLFGLSLAFLPLSSSDAQAMHMAYGALFKTNHQIIPLHFFLGGFWPHLSEMIWLFGTMLYKSSVPALLVNLQIFFLIGVGIFIIARMFISRPYAFLASALFLVSTNSFYQYLMIDVKEEFLLAALATAALFCLCLYIQDRSIRRLLLLCLFVGYTGATKNIYGLVPVAALLVALILSELRSGVSIKNVFRDVLVVLILSGVILTPWYFGQVYYRSNLFYPFKIFQLSNESLASMGSDPRSKENNLIFTLKDTESDKPDAINRVLSYTKSFFTTPWMMTKPEIFGQTLTVGFLFLFLMTPFLKKPNWNLIFPILIYALGLYCIYILGPPNNRRFIPMFAAWSILGTFILDNIEKNRLRLGKALLSILMVIMAHSAYKNYLIPKPYGGLSSYIPVVANVAKRNKFLNQTNLGLIDITSFVNSKTPNDSKFFLYPLIPGYYLDRNYIWGDKLHAGDYLGYSKMTRWEDLLERLKSIKVSHIIFNSYGYNSRPHYHEEMPNKWVPEIINQSAYFVFGSNPPTATYSVYKLAYSANIGEKKLPESLSPYKLENGKFFFKVDNYSPNKEYQVEGYLATEDMNEFKTQSPGDLMMGSILNKEVKTVGRVFLKVNSNKIDDKIHFKFLITPYLTGNGVYVFNYKHYPSYGAVKLIKLKINSHT